jgi:hypothetical protein
MVILAGLSMLYTQAPAGAQKSSSSSSDTDTTAAAIPSTDIMLGMVLLEAAVPKGLLANAANTPGNEKSDFEIRRVWDDGSLYQIKGICQGYTIEVSCRSLWSDKSEYIISGKYGTGKIDLDVRDIYRDRSTYSFSGTIGPVPVKLEMLDESNKNGLVTINGMVGSAHISLSSQTFPDSTVLNGPANGMLVHMRMSGDEAKQQISGQLGSGCPDFAIEDVWADGSDLHITGSHSSCSAPKRSGASIQRSSQPTPEPPAGDVITADSIKICFSVPDTFFVASPGFSCVAGGYQFAGNNDGYVKQSVYKKSVGPVFSLEAKARWTGGAKNDALGLVFLRTANGSDYYYYQMTSSGSCCLAHRDSTGSHPVTPWYAGPRLDSGMVYLDVISTGTEVKCFSRNSRMIRYRLPQLPPQWSYIGMSASSSVNCVFDDFRYTKGDTIEPGEKIAAMLVNFFNSVGTKQKTASVGAPAATSPTPAALSGNDVDAITEATEDEVETIPFIAGDTWSGTYSCASVNNLTLRITGVSGYSVDAVFEFYHTAAKASGSFIVKGTYDPLEKKIEFVPQRWIVQPSGFQMVGLDGRLSRNEMTFSGIVTHALTCKLFSVRRQPASSKAGQTTTR